jgi:antitoxin component of MazEF toxin-antitoxin module
VGALSLELEVRRKAGLPAHLLEEVGWSPGTYVMVRINSDGGILLEPVSKVLDKYAGAARGLARHMFPEQFETAGAPRGTANGE